MLMIAGPALMVLGTLLPWLSGNGESFNGWDLRDFENDTNYGAGFTVIAVIVAAFGITTLAAKRVLPIAILAVIFAAFGVFAAVARLSDASDVADIFDVDVGAGLWVLLLGSLVGLGGAIWCLSVRRRWRAAV